MTQITRYSIRFHDDHDKSRAYSEIQRVLDGSGFARITKYRGYDAADIEHEWRLFIERSTETFVDERAVDASFDNPDWMTRRGADSEGE